MKFKKINPDMIIHCPKEEDAEALLEHLEELGYMWAERTPLSANNYWSNFKDRTCYWIYDSEAIAYGNIRSAEECNKAITEFSDLIEPTDSPMTAEEVLEWLKHAGTEKIHEVFGYDYAVSPFEGYTAEEGLRKITAYEAAKETPKPVKVKEGYYCDIYTEDEQILSYIMYGVDEQTATANAREKAIQNTMETGNRTFANVMFVCEKDEV